MLDLKPIIIVLIIIIPYLLGSIPFSYIFVKKLKGEDIRKKGSGNAGTSNVLRSYGWKIGVLTLICDIGKGMLSACFGVWIAGDVGMYIASIFAVVGHNYSIYLKFKGGKGIACSTGVFLIIQPVPTIFIFISCIIIVSIVKIMSVGSIIGLLASVIAALVISNHNIWWDTSAIIIAVLGLIAHHENILRLKNGTERKLNLLKNR